MKIALVFVLLIIAPIVVAFSSGCFVQDKYFFWGYNCSNYLIYSLNFLALLGSAALVYLSYRANDRNILLRVLGIILTVLFIAHLFIFYSLSNIALF